MAYQFPLEGGRINASVGGNSTSAGAGYSLISTGTLLLAGGNNITLSQNGSAITISGANAPSGSINFSASNTSANLASVTFSNSNGVSFGLNAGVITASHNALTSQSNQALSASNGSFAFQTAGFSNANGVTFGTSAGSIMTASVNTSYAASNHSHGNPTLNLTNISGTTASASNGLTLSLSAASQSNQSLGFTAGTTGGGNTSLTSTGTFDARSLYLNAYGNISAGFSQSSLFVSGSQSAQTQSNVQGIIALGSTNRTGDISFANSNGVTFGLSNNTITASVAAGGGGGVALANSQTTYTSGTVNLLEGGGAITIASTTGQKYNFSVPAQSSLSVTGALSISRNASTISIGAPAFSAGISNIGNTSGTSGTASNQVIFAGGNNITLSQSTGAGGNTISIIGGAGGGGGGGIALYDGVSSISSGTARISAGGALTASVSGQTLSLNVPATSSISVTGALSLSNNGSTISIGAPATSSLIGTNGVSISTTSNSIYFNGMAGTLPRWEYPTAVFSALPAIANNSLSLQHMYVPFYVTGTEMKIGGSLAVGTHTSASTGSATINYKMGIYTLSGSTLSLLTSGSGSTNFGVSSSSTASLAGMRQFTVPMNVNMTPGQYWVGAILSTATNYASNSIGFTLYGNNQMASAASNAILSPMGIAVTAAPRDVYQFQGMYGTTTTAFPSAIQGSQINNSGASMAMRAQFYNAIYSATY